MSESNFRQTLSRKFKKEFVITHIESPSTAAGAPDSHFLLKKKHHRRHSGNRTIWIELKHEKGSFKKVDLRKAQYIWHRRYAREGGKSFILVRQGSDYMYLWDGIYARELYDGKLDKCPKRTFLIRSNGYENLKEHLMTTLVFD